MSIKDGWFSETEVLWPGQKFSLEVSRATAVYLVGVNMGRTPYMTQR